MISFALASSLFLVAVASASLEVPTTSGLLHGEAIERFNSQVLQFVGVPYAQPPIGNLRFLPPQELISDVERDATHYGASCYQPPHLKEVISPLLQPKHSEVSEDCLFLNIYVPKIANSDLLPVMVWLPGEGFDYSDANQFDGSYLAALGQVIVVTVNYRVGVFGFLSSLIDSAPGNVAFLDQQMALKWVKKNIKNFGGNSDSVTLFGRFTGAMSVSVHLTSSLGNDEQLFHRVILQNGIAVGDWVFDRDPMNATLSLAQMTGCIQKNMERTISCLRQIPAKELLKKSLYIPQRWRPVVDGVMIKEEPLSSVQNNHHAPVDVLLGFNNDEGSICLLVHYAMKTPFYKKMLDNSLTNEDFHQLISEALMDIKKKNNSLVTELTAHEYSYLDPASSLRDKYINFCSDIYVTSHMEKMAQLLAAHKKARVYMYQFAHRPSFSINPSFIEAGHGDDVLYTFGLVHKMPSASLKELDLSKRTVAAIANFAKNGNPNPEESMDVWPEYTLPERKLLRFSNEVVGEKAVETSPYARSVSFWYDIIPFLMNYHSNSIMTAEYLEHSNIWSGSSKTAYLIGSTMSAPTAEYVVLGLVFANVLLLTTTAVTLRLFLKLRHEIHFQRLH